MHRQSIEIQKALTQAIQARRNVLIKGVHGIGKSSMVVDGTQELGLAVAYFNAATLDPFADLVGIPVPVGSDEAKRILFLRPDRVNQAQVICFDDLNRAPARVLNAVFELIQFRSINGEPLPKLVSVIGIINPANGDYQVQELDPALVDRFHVFLELPPSPDPDWFVEKFGQKLGRALVDWHSSDLDDQQRPKISPRRLEYLGRNLQDGIDPKLSFPPDAKFPLHLLEARLRQDSSVLKIEDFLADPDRYQALVATDLDVAVRFSQLLPMMRPRQKHAVKWILLALPPEILSALQTNHRFLLKEVVRTVETFESKRDAQAYRDLLNGKLTQPLPSENR